jgi:hypothetical protein
MHSTPMGPTGAAMDRPRTRPRMKREESILCGMIAQLRILRYNVKMKRRAVAESALWP